ncbi:MAG: DUF1206 domain-containing protein [Marmoricola sp.]
MSEVQHAGRRAERSDTLDHAVRIGLVAYALVHLLLAYICFRLALGDGGHASSAGAFRTLAAQPFGRWVLIAVAAGFVLMVVWRLLDGIFGHREYDGFSRWSRSAVDIGSGVTYAVLGLGALRTALGSASKPHTRAWTAQLMDLPAGQVLLGAIGVGVAAIGVLMIWTGISGRTAEQLDSEGSSGDSGRAYLLVGGIGHVGKGGALMIVAGLLCYAAITHDPHRSGGLDVALHDLLGQPFGPWLLGAIGAGIGCFGLFCLIRARHLSH